MIVHASSLTNEPPPGLKSFDRIAAFQPITILSARFAKDLLDSSYFVKHLGIERSSHKRETIEISLRTIKLYNFHPIAPTISQDDNAAIPLYLYVGEANIKQLLCQLVYLC